MVVVVAIIEDIMDDRHVREIANAIKSGASSIATAIFFGFVYASCMMQCAASTIHH